MATTDGLRGLVLEGRYRLHRLIAHGGMSSVYAGVDLRLDRPVAIKIMDPSRAGDRRFVERFELEARAAARLHHPAVVAVHDQGVDSGYGFLVMELVTGGTLRDVLRARGVLDPAQALAVIEPVLAALAAAHHAGLVHRDIKPENVLIGTDGSVKVADFGLVRAATETGLTSSNVILGTVAYLSPEQVSTGIADARSDVYSAGILLYEMLTGTVPYTADTAISVAYRHVNDDVPAPSARRAELPPALDELVVRSTQRDPAARPADASVLLGELPAARAALALPATHVTVPVPDNDRTEIIAAVQAPRVHAGPRGTRMINAPGTGEDAPAPNDAPSGDGPPTRTRRRVLLAALVVVLAALAGTGGWWLTSGRYATVPSVAGMDAASARDALDAAHLHIAMRKAFDNSVRPGHVARTDPAAGTRALRGDTVTVVVSKGRPTVPDIAAGTAPSTAKHAIAAAGLHVRQGSSAYSDSVAKGTVLRVSPSSGTHVDVDATVTIVLSKGPAPKPVPDVSGMSHDAAFAALRAAGMTPYDEDARFSGSVDAGNVISTDPPAGTMIQGDADHRVGVVVSDAVTVPQVVGEPVGQAVAKLHELGLTVHVRQFTHSKNSRVLSASPRPGSTVRPDSTVTITAFP